MEIGNVHQIVPHNRKRQEEKKMHWIEYSQTLVKWLSYRLGYRLRCKTAHSLDNYCDPTSKHCSIHNNFTIHRIWTKQWNMVVSLSIYRFWIDNDNTEWSERTRREYGTTDMEGGGQIMQIAKTHCEHKMRAMGWFSIVVNAQLWRSMFIATMDHADYRDYSID